MTEGVLMEAFSCAMEILEYYTYLKGETHIVKVRGRDWGRRYS